MKKIIPIFLILLFILIMAVSCGQNKETVDTSENINANVESTVNNEDTENKEESQNIKEDDKSTELFGVPQKAEDYYILDLSDPENEYFVEEYGGRLFGMEGFLIIGAESAEGEYMAGSGFFIWARDGAFVIKEINYSDKTYYITLDKVEKGTPQSQEMLYILAQKPFKKQVIKYADGRDLLNIMLLDKQVGLYKDKAEFQKVDIENNTIDIIPAGSTLVKTFTMVDVSPESLEGLQKGDIVEVMRGTYQNTIYAIRKVDDADN